MQKKKKNLTEFESKLNSVVIGKYKVRQTAK